MQLDDLFVGLVFLDLLDRSFIVPRLHLDPPSDIVHLPEPGGVRDERHQRLEQLDGVRHVQHGFTLGVYTHVDLHDQTAAIASLPPPPTTKSEAGEEVTELLATGTDGQIGQEQLVPPVVPSGAQHSAQLVASKGLRIAADCTDKAPPRGESSDVRIAAKSISHGRYRSRLQQLASPCITLRTRSMKVSPTGFEPVTFGFGGGVRNLC